MIWKKHTYLFRSLVYQNKFTPVKRLSNYYQTDFMIISKMSKCMVPQIKPHTTDHLDPGSIIIFLCHLKLACDNIRAQDEAAVWLVHLFIKKLAPAALYTRLVSKHKARTRKTGNYLLPTNVTYNNYKSIANTTGNVSTLIHQPSKTLPHHGETLVDRTRFVETSKKNCVWEESLSRG